MRLPLDRLNEVRTILRQSDRLIPPSPSEVCVPTTVPCAQCARKTEQIALLERENRALHEAISALHQRIAKGR